jgi:hypothetical protein
MCIVFGCASSASAIVVENYSMAEDAPSGLNWNYVYNYKGSSAVSVGGNWLLTAAHVAYGGSGEVSYGTTTNKQVDVDYYGSADLALVRFEKAFPGSYPLFTGALDPPNPEVIMVGYGSTGSVSADQWSYSEDGRGTKRWGSQRIDLTGTFRTKPDEVNNVTSQGFYMDFHLGNTTNEAGFGSGDSGGGVFYEVDGSWKLAGVMIGHPSFSTMFAASMAYDDYSGWVFDTIPEPHTIGLMSLSTICLFLARRIRRRKLAGGSVFPVRRKSMCDLFRDAEGEEASGEAAECANGLTQKKHMLQIRPFSAWMEQFQFWIEELDKAFWNNMVQVIEHGSAKVDAIRSALMRSAARRIDVFLDIITCDRIVRGFATRTKSIRTSLKRHMIRGLDAFLDTIYWDKMVSVYETRKKAIRSAKEEALRDSYRSEGFYAPSRRHECQVSLSSREDR